MKHWHVHFTTVVEWKSNCGRIMVLTLLIVHCLHHMTTVTCHVCYVQVGSLCIGRAGACVVRLPNSWLSEFGSSLASRPGLATCQGCLSSSSVCPCQPVACPLLPKTFRSAGTSTERSVSAVSRHFGQTQNVSDNSSCMQLASRQALSHRRTQQADAVRPTSGAKQRSYDVGCGFVQFCHKHIFANSPALSSVSACRRKISQNLTTVESRSMSQCDSFNSHFNPCYSNSSPPEDDDDDDINLDAVSLCDSLCSSRVRKSRALPVVSEMSESCFEGLQSSVHEQVIDLPKHFRPLSWAGSVDDCLIGSCCICSNQPAFSVLKSDKWDQPVTQLTNSASQMTSDEVCETPFYWELELPITSCERNPSSQASPLPDACQKLASPLRMGTLAFDVRNVSDSSHTAMPFTKKPLCQNSEVVVDTMKVPKMGCLPESCCMCHDCHRICYPRGINRRRHAVSGRTPLAPEVHIPRTCKCMKQRRCPTPPRMLSPAVDDDSLRIPVADIWNMLSSQVLLISGSEYLSVKCSFQLPSLE